jgi:hypothetical protein
LIERSLNKKCLAAQILFTFELFQMSQGGFTTLFCFVENVRNVEWQDVAIKIVSSGNTLKPQLGTARGARFRG